MNVKKIVERYLLKNGYDGLAGHDCGCYIDDLMPCSHSDGPDISECVPAYRRVCVACTRNGCESRSGGGGCMFPGRRDTQSKAGRDKKIGAKIGG